MSDGMTVTIPEQSKSVVCVRVLQDVVKMIAYTLNITADLIVRNVLIH